MLGGAVVKAAMVGGEGSGGRGMRVMGVGSVGVDRLFITGEP